MIEVTELGWDARAIGEIDHRRLKAPSIKLRSATSGDRGDVVYCVDLRFRRPNVGECLSAPELHSVEHFLLAGFQRRLPANFVSVGIMGCQTGFYLILLNEGRAQAICGVLADILTDMQGATVVPYARIDQCGNFRNHSLELARNVARQVLERKSTWLEVV